MATTVYTPTASQLASAALHLERQSEWRYVRITGTRYVVIESGNSGRTYLVRADAAGCSCIWYTRTLTRCSHMLALELGALEDELREQAVKAELAEINASWARRGYGDLYPTCQAPDCDGEPEPRSHSCYRHQLVDAF